MDRTTNSCTDEGAVKIKIRQFFENDARKYEQDRWGTRPESVYDYTVTKDALFETLTRLVGKHRHFSVLDVGCGTGFWGRELRKAGFDIEYTGLDFSAKMIAKTIEADTLRQVSSNYILGDAEALPLHGAKYDLILCIHTLEYLMDPFEFIVQCKDILPAGGHIIIVTKNAHGVLWRMAKGATDIVCTNPLVFQRWFSATDLLTKVSSAGFEPVNLLGITLRPPSYLGDLNDTFTLGLPKWLSRLICKAVLPFESKLSQVEWFRFLFWHLLLACRRT